jgi:predicted nucleic acid-binding protein
MDNEKMIIISDSSPLISLAVIEKLNILENLYKEIYVPTAVYEEVVRLDKPFARELKLFFNGKTRRVQNKMAVEILLSDIGSWRSGGNSLL